MLRIEEGVRIMGDGALRIATGEGPAADAAR